MACSPPLTINESEIAQLLQGYRLALKVKKKKIKSRSCSNDTVSS
jgi:hypothetical protein